MNKDLNRTEAGSQPSNTAEQHSRATQPSNTAEQHSRATQPSNTAEQHSRATQPSNTAEQHSRATQPSRATVPAGIKQRLEYNAVFRIENRDPDEAHDGYQLKFLGKNYAKYQAGLMPETVLVPDKIHNTAPEHKNSHNIFLTGDNLEALRHLQNCYARQIKMIYIDPPYNTGTDGFVYKDKFALSDKDLQNLLGYTEDEVKRVRALEGRSSHSAWLTFIYPRLKMAHNLLADDGVIFISIDDNEQANLKLLCDEIFGEVNFRGALAVKRGVKSLNSQFADNGLKSLNIGYENILIYAKSDNFLMSALTRKKEKFSNEGAWQSFYNDVDRPTMRYDILGFTPEAGQWRWSKEKALEAVRNYNEYTRIYASEMSLEEYWEKTDKKLKFIMRKSQGEGKNGGVYYWLSPNDSVLRTTNWTDISASETKRDLDIPFSHPKSVSLIKHLLELANTVEQDFDPIILDFFAGSGTTAQAVMELNKQDGGKRRYILCQLDEKTAKDSEAHKQGYQTIDQIARERIKRAAAKLEDASGFKHFYLKEPKASSLDKIFEFNPDNPPLIADNMAAEFAYPAYGADGEGVILATWAAADGCPLDERIKTLDIAGYQAHNTAYIESFLYLIAPGWGAEQTKELANRIGANKLSLNRIIIYPYSFSFEALRELELALRQSLNKSVSIEKRW